MMAIDDDVVFLAEDLQHRMLMELAQRHQLRAVDAADMPLIVLTAINQPMRIARGAEGLQFLRSNLRGQLAHG